MRRITISAGGVSASAILDENTTADAIWEALPIAARGNRWGDEIYFEIPVQLSQADDARDVVEAGELGYWPVGHAFCIFWGPTPASRGNEPRAYSPVNVFGRLEGDPLAFDAVAGGTEIKIQRAQS
ncbi:MAG TPA: cyclophilin-like fold protein [Anaerolineae bacterium]|nr:cyclophilin-like fold protein [Anaerolineae bacterium]